MAKVFVIGSINQDIVIQTSQIANPGETVFGNNLDFFPGGKGANQAVATALAGGGNITFIGKVGDDIFGDNMLKYLASYHLADNIIKKDGVATGAAVIYVDDDGENSIIVVSGANGDLTFDDCSLLNEANHGDYLLLQNEIPTGVAFKLLKYAKKLGMRTVINVAPATELPNSVISDIDLLIVNEHEYEVSLGQTIDTAKTNKEIEDTLLATSKKLGLNIVLTLGARGVAAVMDGEAIWIDGIEVDTVDTTGAGDCFTGSLVASLANDIKPIEALKFANAAAALSVTKSGASKSYASKEEVLDFINK